MNAGTPEEAPGRERHLLLMATPWRAAALLDGCFAGSLGAPLIAVNGACWRLHRVDGPVDALRCAASSKVDLLALCGMPTELALQSVAGSFRRLARGAGLVGVAGDPFDLPDLESAVRQGLLDDAFLDDGSGRVLPALLRLEHDRRSMQDPGSQRPVVVLVEDESAFASFLLPCVIDVIDGADSAVNRPVVALARCFEEAEAVISGAGTRLAAVISDLGYPRGDRLDPFAGLALLRLVRRGSPSVPVLAQSFEAVNQSEAEAYGLEFLHKRAPDYLERLRSFLVLARLGPWGERPRAFVAASPAIVERSGLTVVGHGPLGGRARGLCALVAAPGHGDDLVAGVRARVATTLVLRPSVGEALLASAELEASTDWAFPPGQGSTARRVLSGRLPESVRAVLEAFLEKAPGPVLVAASTSLDDLPGRPVDSAIPVFVVADRAQQLPVRAACLDDAVRRVFAAAWLPSVADALEGTPFVPEQLRLSVMVQALTGAERGCLFFPLVSARAWSFNAYPFPGMRPEDGAAELLLGVCGECWSPEALRFCPAQPRSLPQLSSVEDVLQNAQRRFAALDLQRLRLAETATPWSEAIAETDVSSCTGDLAAADLLSTFLSDADRVVDGVRPEGVPLLTFNGLLKGRLMPFPDAVKTLLEVTTASIGVPLELHLAVEPGRGGGGDELVVSGIRPMDGQPVASDMRAQGRVVIRSGHALGLAGVRSYSDVVLVLPGLDRSRTVEAAGILEQLNRELKAAGRRYLLVGPGRWGSRDPWLGIPVAWSQISEVGAIVETDFIAFEGDPSFGSHFFHTLTSQGIPYLSVHRSLGGGEVDWKWLEGCQAQRSLGSGLIRLLRCEPPLEVRLEGASRVGLVVARSSA